MATIRMLKHGDAIALVWGKDGAAGESPTQGGRTVQPWEEIDGKLASDYDDGEHEVDDANLEPPKAMASTLFLKDGERLAVLWDEQDGDDVIDLARVVEPNDLIDGKRASDYADGTYVVADSNRRGNA